jgi:hypothetical protein
MQQIDVPVDSHGEEKWISDVDDVFGDNIEMAMRKLVQDQLAFLGEDDEIVGILLLEVEVKDYLSQFDLFDEVLMRFKHSLFYNVSRVTIFGGSQYI